MAVYHVEPCIRETGEFVDNGLHQIFVNTCCDDGSKIARLMRHFEETDFSDDEFPKISERMHNLKHNKEEVAKMMGKVQDYAKSQTIQAVVETLISVSDLSETEIINKIMQKYSLTHEEAKSYYDKCISA